MKGLIIEWLFLLPPTFLLPHPTTSKCAKLKLLRPCKSSKSINAKSSLLQVKTLTGLVMSVGIARHGSKSVKQITKTNFSSTLQAIKSQIIDSDFIAISTQKTGALFSWRRVMTIDTPEIAYLKSKIAADSFQVLQFAVCPFSIHGSVITAFPYNFHLFPRDELHLGLPSYGFSCQNTFLTAMAQEGFDFNACIYDGISYLSKAQESKANKRNSVHYLQSVPTSSNLSVADSLFMRKVKSKVELWRNACRNNDKNTDGDLVISLRKLILGNEVYGTRPSLCIDVCSERQVQLAFETVNKMDDDLVPLVSPDKSGAPKAVRVVLTSSDEDKKLLLSELEDIEEEQNLKVKGFREVLDLVSASQKPIITYNSLNDLTSIHSNFIAPLPPSLSEFMSSLRLAFPSVIDVCHLSKEVGPLRRAKTMSAAMSYLERQFFVPIELKIPHQGDVEKSHGSNVLKLTTLFAKLHNLLKLAPESQNKEHCKSLKKYANKIFPTFSSLVEFENDERVNLCSDNDNYKKVSSNNLVFLWGFGRKVTATGLKNLLHGIHPVFSEEFEIHMMDKTCSIIVFSNSTAAQNLINVMNTKEIGPGGLKEMISNGLKGTGYETYKKVFQLGIFKEDLADTLDAVLIDSETGNYSSTSDDEIYWNSELMIDLNSL